MSRYALDIRRGQSLYYEASFELSGVVILLAFRWLPLLSRWQVEAKDPDGVLLGLPQIAQPGGELLLDRRGPRAPEGHLYWTGSDDYGLDDIGQGLQLIYDDTPPAKVPLLTWLEAQP